nr:YdcF family protein [Aquabacterium sp.]
QAGLTQPPPPLATEQIAALRRAPDTAILVLGAGRRTLLLEYDQPDLTALTLERLRYGWWLARQTGLPLGYSGGVGHGVRSGPSEAAVAALVIARDRGVPLRWAEDRSRDTNENAQFSVAMLQADGISQVVLVTHGFHQQRALAAFQRAVARSGQPLQVVPAPTGLRPPLTHEPGDFLPGHDGLAHSIWAVHEWLGWLAGA